MHNTFLITGYKNGFGQFCHEQLSGLGYSRQTPWEETTSFLQSHPESYIIHAAASAKKSPQDDLYGFMEDNILLTDRLTRLPHEKFIYLSSIDVYPSDNTTHHEDEKLDIDKTKNWYAKSKLISESIIQANCPNHLILRLSALLGTSMRPNNLTRLLFESAPTLTLTADSTLNCVLYEEVLDFIIQAITHDYHGIFNMTSVTNASLSQVATLVQKPISFGQYNYITPHISNKKASSLLLSLNQSSLEKIMFFYQQSFKQN